MVSQAVLRAQARRDAKIIDLYEGGMNTADIRKAMDLSHSQVYYVVTRHKKENDLEEKESGKKLGKPKGWLCTEARLAERYKGRRYNGRHGCWKANQ